MHRFVILLIVTSKLFLLGIYSLIHALALTNPGLFLFYNWSDIFVGLAKFVRWIMVDKFG